MVPPRHVIPSGVKRSRGIFPSCWFYLVLVHSPTWWIPPLRFAPVGMTKWGTFSVLSKTVSSFRAGTAHRPFPTVSLVGGFFSSAQVVFVTLLGGAPRSESKFIDCRGQSHLDSIDESSPLHCVIPFNQPGCIRNVAGGRLPPLHTLTGGF